MVSDSQIVIRLLLALFLSGLIGFEREVHGRAAGLRTHILVCMGATLIMLTSMHIFDVYQGKTMLDPARMAAQVVSGIGFLGAGTIIRFRASIRGLTTAASLWATAGVGIAIGSGFYIGACATTALLLIALMFLPRLEGSLVRKDWYKTFRIEIETTEGTQALAEVRKVLSDYNAEIKDLEIVKDKDRGVTIVDFNVKLLTNSGDEAIVSDIADIPGVRKAMWR